MHYDRKIKVFISLLDRICHHLINVDPVIAYLLPSDILFPSLSQHLRHPSKQRSIFCCVHPQHHHYLHFRVSPCSWVKINLFIPYSFTEHPLTSPKKSTSFFSFRLFPTAAVAGASLSLVRVPYLIVIIDLFYHLKNLTIRIHVPMKH